jgi:type II secretory pathway component GspD/PulD (secretin)
MIHRPALTAFPLLLAALTLCFTSAGHAQVATTVPPVSFLDLQKPEVAAALNLTAEQKTQVEQIVAEKAAASANGDDASRLAAETAANDKLKTLLTEDQQRLFSTMFGGKKLRFNFRNQKWPDVLDWIAREADLSLVMEVPPPGVFSYSDSKDYSTAESIDLINGWLLTKGFTLVRRERMLMCLDLKAGLPEGAVPRITADELDTRSRFEFVSVLIPLEGRPAETVLTEVKPLLGTYGKAEALNQTQQLLVYDTAQTLRLIREIVQRIPVSPDFAMQSAKPVLVIYPIQHANPTQAGEVLKEIVTGAVVVDEKALQITVNATPIEQEKARTIISQLEQNQGPDQRPQLQVYPVEVSDAIQLLATLRLFAPDGQYRIDAPAGKLIAWASQRDQQRISESLEALQSQQANGGMTQMRVYSLKTADPSVLSTVISTLVPTARVSVNLTNQSLIVLAGSKDHETVQGLIQQVETNAVGMAPELKFYPLQKIDGNSSIAFLQTIAPLAKITYEAIHKRYSVIASPDDHAAIAATLEKLESTAPETQRDLKFYDVATLGATDANALLASEFANITFLPTTDGTRLMAWVSGAEDERIRATLTKVGTEKPFEASRMLEFYSIRDLGPSVTTVLTSAIPKATITAGASPDQLAIVGSAADHQKVKQLLEKLNATKSIPTEKSLAVYPVQGVTPSSVLQVLQPLVDADVQLTVDPTGQQIFVRATADKQAQIQAVISQVTAAIGASSAKETKTYTVGAPNADEAQEVLAALFRDATIVTDSDRKLIVATATPAQHATILQITEQMRGLGIDGDRPIPAVYSLKNVSAIEVQSLLQSMYSRFEGVRLSVNEKTGRLIVLARPEQQDAIRPLIEQLDQNSEGDAGRQELAVFRLHQFDGLAVQTALQPLLPANAQVTADRIGRQLFISASAEDMPAIRELVQQMISTQGSTAGLETRTYRLRPFEADEAQEVVSRMFPDSTLVTDTSQEILVATATAEQHETIRSIVDQMTSALPSQNAPEARAYPLRMADGVNAVQVFDSLFRRSDNVRVSFDTGTRSLVAVARPEQHEVIKNLISQLEPADSAEAVRTLEVYPMPGMESEAAVQIAESVLRATDPSASTSWDRSSRQLVVTATAAGHSALAASVARIQESDSREMDVMQLRVLSASSAQNAIEGLYGERFSRSADYPVIQADEDLQQLLVRGSKRQLQDIRALLVKMGETELAQTDLATGAVRRNLRIIPVQGDVEPALKRIQDLWPQVRRNPLRVLRPQGESPSTPPSEQPQSMPPANPAVVDPTEGGQFSVPAEPLYPRQTPPENQAAGDPAHDADSASVSVADQDEPAPIVIVPGVDRITIASDDLDALDQLESILRATTSGSRGTAGGSRNRDFSVYQLRNAGAEDVAETLESVYESRAGVLAFGSVVIVPETRMNALIVYGGRTDRDRIEQLLEILDSEKLPDSGRIFRTQVIPVQHADAEELEDVLRGVYRTEMAAGGSRRSIEIPAGIDSSVANVLRQINAAASAPLLTIQVQTETNSLVVKAPQNLIEELTELVTQLDDAAATNRAQGVTLIPLKKTNTRRVMQILEDVIK